MIDKEFSQTNFTTYLLDANKFDELLKISFDSNLGTKNIRWSCWRAFLGLIPVGKPEKIKQAIQKQRDDYYREFDKFFNVRNKAQEEGHGIDDPLSKGKNVSTIDFEYFQFSSNNIL